MKLAPLLACTLVAVHAVGCRNIPLASTAHFAKGIEHRDAGHLGLAIDSFQLAIETAGEESRFFTDALLERGECHLTLGEAEHVSSTERIDHLVKALADFQAVATWDAPTDVDKARALVGQGRALLGQGKRTQAQERFHEVLRLSPAPELQPHRLAAHRELGWLVLDQVLVRYPESAPGDDDLLRATQEQFFEGLELARDDPLSNLGHGICLLLRDQATRAMPYLQRAIDAPQPEHPRDQIRPDDPRPQYFLARATEASSGYHRAALASYSQALERDRGRRFLPLYHALADSLPVYLQVAEQPASHFILQLIQYAGTEPGYWASVDALATELRLDPELSDANEEACLLARAVAAARRGLTEDATDALLELRSARGFREHLDRVYPSDTVDIHGIYGRSVALYELGEYGELERWLSGPEIRTLLEGDRSTNPLARETLTLKASALTEIAQTELAASGPGATAPPTAANRLAEARRILESRLLEDADDSRALRGIARTYELERRYADALVAYQRLIAGHADDLDAYRRVREIHQDETNAAEATRLEAWRLLETYRGDDPQLGRYVRKVRETLGARTSGYCPSCGRLASAEDARCLECGRVIGTRVAN